MARPINQVPQRPADRLASLIRFIVHSGGTLVFLHASHHGIAAHRE
jgi:hypothetical protein